MLRSGVAKGGEGIVRNSGNGRGDEGGGAGGGHGALGSPELLGRHFVYERS